MAASRKPPAKRRLGAAAGADAAFRLPRDPKGRRAQFYPDPAVDQLMAIVVALAAEVSVAFDRIDTLERLLEERGVIAGRDVEDWQPDAAASAERARRREALIERVFQVLSQYARGA